MARHIPFINREQELARIDTFMQEWGTRRIICIDGAAGVGKTWFLREIHQRYRQTNQSSLTVTDILDFSDPILHVPQNTAHRIAHMLDASIFDPYLFVLHNWHKMELTGMSREQLDQAAQALSQTFVNCFNMLSAQQRIVLFGDSMDNLENLEIFQYMVETGKQLDNMVLILSGRDAARYTETLLAGMGSEVQILRLQPFTEQASLAYLHQKQAQLDTSLDQALMQNLGWLVGGHPIMLNLVAAWATQAQIPAWLTSSSLAELQALPEEHQQQQQHELESLVIRHLIPPDTLLGKLFLLMARISPVDMDMVMELLDIPAADVQQLWAEATDSVFIRTLAGNRLTLYGDIQRMINAYVWPTIDPDGQQRRQNSIVLEQYLEHQAQVITRRIEQVQATAQIEAQREQNQPPSTAFKERQILEQELWLRKGQQLEHMLAVDIETGFHTFLALFDEATRTYRLRYRGALLQYMQPYLDSLTPAQQYILKGCEIETLFDLEEYLQVRQLASVLLEQDDLSPEQRVDMLLKLGNVEIRLGYLDQGVAHFDRAMRLCTMHDLRPCIVRTLNARGWAYRNQGKHDLALADYIEAYQRSLQLENMEQTAWILTNISFIGSLRGDRQSAYETCQTALNLWRDIGSQRGLGAAYSTLGGFYVRFNEPGEALTAYNQALDIFDSQQDNDWVSLVRCGRAVAFQVRGELERAEDDLAWTMAHGPVNLRTRVLYTQGVIAWDRGDLQLTRQKLEQCRQLSQEIGDHFHDYKSFADLVELMWEFGEYERWRLFSLDLEDIYQTQNNTDSMRLRGSCLRKIGDLALCHGDYDAALAFYEEGFPILAEHEVHDRYSIRAQLRQTNQRIVTRVPGKILSRLGSALAHFWRSNSLLVVKYPEALLTFHRWQQEGDARAKQEEAYGQSVD